MKLKLGKIESKIIVKYGKYRFFKIELRDLIWNWFKDNWLKEGRTSLSEIKRNFKDGAVDLIVSAREIKREK